MTEMLPWILLFFALLFGGVVLLFIHGSRAQDRALAAIFAQQKAIRMELERLASAQDALLGDRLLADDLADDLSGEAALPRPETLVPGLDRLLLSPPERPAGRPADRPAERVRTGALPDIQL